MAMFLIKLILSSFLTPICLSHPLKIITTCLIDHDVTNFSTSHSTSYLNILSYSLQNLRFSEPNYTKPSLVILPCSKEQLASSIVCSRKGGYEVKVRSGGHSYEALSSITYYGKPFLIIDVMNLDRVMIDVGSKTGWVEAGATIGQVHYAIADLSKGAYGFSAGSCPTVGMGGHISGGGFGLLSRKYGLAADNVVDALLVDSNGRVLDRTSMGEDVFWALRGGGGGSFGIVYAWKIKLLDVPRNVTVFQLLRKGNAGHITKLLHKWQYVGPFLNDKFYLSLYVVSHGNGINVDILTLFRGLYLGPKVKAISIINKKFRELGVREDECNELSWIESVLYFSGLNSGSTIDDLKNRHYSKGYFKAKSDYVRTPIPIEGIKGAINILLKQPNGSMIIEPYGGKMARIPQDSTPFPHRKGNLFIVEYTISWEKQNEGNMEEYLSWIRKFYDYMTPYVSSNPRVAYVNYLDLDIGGLDNISVHNSRNAEAFDDVEKGRVWGKKYFLNNYDRLVKAKTMIDPCNYFRHPMGIPSNMSRDDTKLIC